MIIEIQNHKWKIQKKNKEEIEIEGKGTLGLTIFPNREIWLFNELKDEPLKQVITHEMVHALLDEFGHSQEEYFNSEFICNFISNNIELIKSLSKEIIDYSTD